MTTMKQFTSLLDYELEQNPEPFESIKHSNQRYGEKLTPDQQRLAQENIRRCQLYSILPDDEKWKPAVRPKRFSKPARSRRTSSTGSRPVEKPQAIPLARVL